MLYRSCEQQAVVQAGVLLSLNADSIAGAVVASCVVQLVVCASLLSTFTLYILQVAWRLDNTDVPVCLPVCLVPHLWCGLWYVGIHPQLGPECVNLQCIC